MDDALRDKLRDVIFVETLSAALAAHAAFLHPAKRRFRQTTADVIDGEKVASWITYRYVLYVDLLIFSSF